MESVGRFGEPMEKTGYFGSVPTSADAAAAYGIKKSADKTSEKFLGKSIDAQQSI